MFGVPAVLFGDGFGSEHSRYIASDGHPTQTAVDTSIRFIASVYRSTSTSGAAMDTMSA